MAEASCVSHHRPHHDNLLNRPHPATFDRILSLPSNTVAITIAECHNFFELARDTTIQSDPQYNALYTIFN